MMRNHFLLVTSCAALVFLAAKTFADGSSTAGLWVGEVTLTKVNETVVGINAANQVVAPDPAVATPVQSPAHLRILLHVDALGQVRLLKNVAAVDKSTNSTPALVLITDESLYPNYPGTGRRFTAAAFDFGDSNANELLNLIAITAANAAATNGNATNAANAVAARANAEGIYQSFVTGAGFRNAALNAALSAKLGALQAKGTNGNATQVLAAATGAANGNFYVMTNRAYAQSLTAAALIADARFVTAVDAIASGAAGGAATAASSNLTATVVGASATNAALAALTNVINAPAIVSPGYQTFITTADFQSAAGVAAAAAAAAAKQARDAGALPALVQNRAQAAALKALTDAGIFKTADKVVNNELLLTGSLGAGGSLAGTIYLGANHPTNPFMHRRHTDHSTGYSITRNLNIQFDAATSTNGLALAGFGVERLTGTYHEEIFGLHKPLGPDQDKGLITEGVILLNRISQVDTLNQ
ncbi:MAG TPA: hypothetical protein VNN22_15585 [Verrucomicrobiae bacterium]|nr:hypothetical protein [Verrucomicrobiae bacterium]